MTLRLLLAPTLCLAALTAACDGDSVRISSTHTENSDAKGALKVVQTLQCPQTLGTLTRKGSATAEGTVCTYTGPRGSEVSLHLVKLDGASAADALKAFEDRLGASLPQAVAQLKASAEEEAARAAETGQTPTEAPAGERASVRAPGVDNRPSEAGWRLVGYEARGPAGGPLVVATVRSRDRDRGRVFEDAKDLVALNVGE